MFCKGFFVFVLEALVGQMHFQVFFVMLVLKTRGSQVALLEQVNLNFVWVVLYFDHRPHSDVEFSLLVQERPLDVFLDDPLGVAGLLVQEGGDVANLVEELDSFALVGGSWFENPLVVLTVLFRNIFNRAQTFTDVNI